MKTLKKVISATLISLLSATFTLLPVAAQWRKTADASSQSSASPAARQPVPQEPIGLKVGDILLSFPRGENHNKIDSASTFVVGAVPAGRTLSCNGEQVYVNSDGFFAHTVKLNYGKNNFSLALSGQENSPLAFTVDRPAPPASLSAQSFNILPESLQPQETLGVVPGDNIQFAARATPGCLLTVSLGAHLIALKPAINPKSKKVSVNLGLDTAFGVTFQRSASAMKDLYLGFYKVQVADSFKNAVPVFKLQKGKKEIKAQSKGSVTVVRQPLLLKTAHDNTVVRLAPGAARSTPLPEAVRMLADGYKGEWWRLELSPNNHVWINREDIVEDDSTALPESKVATVNLGTDNYGARVAIPLNQRLPFQIDQDLNGKKLLLHIYGVISDTDFVTSDLRPGDSAAAKRIEYVSWKQKTDSQYELTTHLKFKQQWGYYASYEGNTLVLHIKSAPNVDPASGSLKGATICVDPGHGGYELGSIGCSGVKEASLNFANADKLRQQLEALGATVIMTRRQDKFISLQDRVDVAIKAGADLLVSIHGNSLPEGRNPLTEHGTSSYWYHAQSMEIAGFAQKNLAKATSFKDYGSHYKNLALCRPSQMPAFLMEIGFMINPDELSSMLKPAFQELVGKSIASSIKNFVFEKIELERAAPAGASAHSEATETN